MKTVFVDRKSVSMGDDTENHRMQLQVRDNCTYAELFRTISDLRYLPSYDTMWLIRSKKREFAAAYYNSSYSNHQSHIIWSHDFDENEELGDDDSFFFDCHLFKREMYKYSDEYDKSVEALKKKYGISDELFQQISAYLTKVRQGS